MQVRRSSILWAFDTKYCTHQSQYFGQESEQTCRYPNKCTRHRKSLSYDQLDSLGHRVATDYVGNRHPHAVSMTSKHDEAYHCVIIVDVAGTVPPVLTGGVVHGEVVRGHVFNESVDLTIW